MKVSFDYQIFNNQRYGGISRYFVRLAQELTELRQEVAVIAPIHQNAYISELPPKIVVGHEVEKYPPRSARFIKWFNHGASSLLINRFQPDVIHETYYNRFSSGKKNIPHIITVYDMIHERFADCFSVRDNTAKIKRIAVERADMVIAISENTRKDLLELYSIEPEKIRTIHLGFDEFSEKTHTRHEPDIPRIKKPFLLYVGNRGGYKNFDNLIKAYASSSWLQSNFDIVAFGGGAFTAREKSFFDDMKIDPSNIVFRYGGDQQLGSFYRNASAFIYPSRYEGFGIPPLEAMAHDCPVIASHVSSIPEVVGDAGSYFDPDSVESMRVVMEQTLCSEQLLLALKEKGRQRLSNFSWKKCAESTLQAYKQLL